MGVDIIRFVKSVLNESKMGFKYYDPPVNKFNLIYQYEDIELPLFIYPLQNNRIFIQVRFPFKIESNISVLLSLYIMEYNHNKAFGTLRMNPDGVVTMEYTYLILKESDCNGDLLKKYLDIISKESLKVYDALKRLYFSPRALKTEDRVFYRILLRENLNRLNGIEAKTSKQYGVRGLKLALKDNSKDETGQNASTMMEWRGCLEGDFNRDPRDLRTTEGEESKVEMGEILPFEDAV